MCPGVAEVVLVNSDIGLDELSRTNEAFVEVNDTVDVEVMQKYCSGMVDVAQARMTSTTDELSERVTR